MKFLLITNNDFDGVGQHAVRTNLYLNKKKYKSKILVLHKSTKNPNVIVLRRSIISRFYSFTLNFLKKNFQDLFSFNNSTVSYKLIKRYIVDFDIILIFSLHKIISHEDLEKIINLKKVVYFRPLDLEFATGGCHINLAPNDDICEKYLKDCSNCPKLNFMNIFDISKKILLKKKFFFDNSCTRIFVENTFTQNIYNKSLVFKKRPVEKIFLGVNNIRTRFFSKNFSRINLGIPKDNKVMLFGTFNLDSFYKGGVLLQEILDMLNKRIENIHSNNITIVTFGNKNSFNLNLSNINWMHLGLVNSDYKLNLLYRSADILLCPSILDNGPHIVTEAFMNNLPVVAFNQGVAQDIIINKVNGYLISCYNKRLFVNAIIKILFKKKNYINDIQNRKIKLHFNTSFEINKIIKYAKSDFIKNQSKK